MMDWKSIRYVPVEDNKGKLSGLVTSRILIRNFLKKDRTSKKAFLVKDMMIQNPTTINQESTIMEAMEKMREETIGCLPVVKPNGELVGIVTEMDFLRITSRLLGRLSDK